jgi:hypothetical protein
MAMRLGGAWVMATMLGFAPLAQAQTPQAPPPIIAEVGVALVLVRVVGPWTLPDQGGISRIVAMADGTRMRLFVQWIADAAQGPVLIDTREVTDVVKDGLIFGDVRVEASENDSSVFLDTLPKEDGLRDTYVLIIQQPGQFRFGPATN